MGAARPLLPVQGSQGGRWRDHRQVINGILWRLRVGARQRSSRANIAHRVQHPAEEALGRSRGGFATSSTWPATGRAAR